MEWFRLITPVLVTIALFILSGIRGDVSDLKKSLGGHLTEHKSLEVCIEKRLTRIETICGGLAFAAEGKKDVRLEGDK